jgi:arylsulfatase A-like enzyme
MRFIDEQPDQPFFIQIAFQKPHHPLLPVKRFWDMYDDDLALPATFDQDPAHRPPHFRRAFEGMRKRQWEYAKPGESPVDGARRGWKGTLACVTQVDDVFGSLMRLLDERGLAENTIVIYGSDHGCYHGIHGIPEKAPGIGSDAVGRVPMIWRVPGITPAGRTCEQLVENIDMAPTLSGLCDLPTMESTDGKDISSLLQGNTDPVREAAFTEHPLSKSVRFGKWRLTYYPRAMFDGEYEGELYDLEADPDETQNLYHDPAHRQVVDEGKSRIIDWLAGTRRVVTSQPTFFHGPREGGKRTYPLAGDGKAMRDKQPVSRLLKEERPLNYT